MASGSALVALTQPARADLSLFALVTSPVCIMSRHHFKIDSLVTQNHRPFNKAMLKAAEREDEEDATAAKKRKPNPAKAKLMDLLPAPRNTSAPAGMTRKPAAFLTALVFNSKNFDCSVGNVLLCAHPSSITPTGNSAILFESNNGIRLRVCVCVHALRWEQACARLR